MIKKNDVKTGKIISIGNNGEGIIKDEDKVIFVPFALLGEVVEYKVLKVTSKCVFAKLLKVIEKSRDRVTPPCKVFCKCGGCQLQHVLYEKQLLLKKQSVENTLKKIAFIDNQVTDVVGCDNEFRYRNKLQLPISNVDGNLAVGFYAENTHRVVEIDDCLINADWTRGIILSVKQYASEFNLKGYDQFTRKGDLREITVREVKGNLIITLVINKKKVDGLQRFVDILRLHLPNKFSLFVNVNTTNSNVIYGDEFYKVYGDNEYYGEMLSIKFPMSVQSFMQVNDNVCEKLYSHVEKIVNADCQSVVIDAYSGAGLMTSILAKNAKKAIGIEIIPQAVELSNKLAESNGLKSKIVNYTGKCEEILPNVLEKEVVNGERVTVVLDPPRKGCDLSVIQSLIENNIDNVIYVSCNPATLARDLGVLTGSLVVGNNGIVKNESDKRLYKVNSITLFDMFPQTKHVETIVNLSKI